MLQKQQSTLRERNMADRRRRILAAAREIIATRGFDGLAMRGLAEQAGVAVKTLYSRRAAGGHRAGIVPD